MKIYYLFFISILILINSCLWLYFHQEICFYQETVDNLVNEKNKIETNRMILNGEDQITGFRDTSIDLSPDIQLIDSAGCVKKIKQEFKKVKKLVLYFDTSDCMACVELILPSLKKLMHEVGESKVCFLITSQNRREVSVFKHINKLNNPIYEVQSLGLSLENENTPFFFILDEQLKTNYVYIPRRDMLQQTEKYLNLIKKRITESNYSE